MVGFVKKIMAGGGDSPTADGKADAGADGYIWHHADWVAGLHWQAEALAAVLAEVEAAHKDLKARIRAEPPVIQDDILLRALTEEGVATSLLADSTTDVPQLRGALMGELGVHGDGRGGRVAAIPRIEDLGRVLVDVVHNVDVAVSHDRFDTWHALLVRGEGRRQDDQAIDIAMPMSMPLPMSKAGKSKGAAQQFTYQPPPVQSLASLPAMVQNLLGCDDSYLLKAGLVHFVLASLRVYADGNGRIARLASHAILLRGVGQKDGGSPCFVSTAPEIARQAHAYYQQLYSAQTGGLDVTPWLGWWLGCVGEAIGHMDVLIAAAHLKHEFWQRFAKAPFNGRQGKMLARLLDGFDDVVSTQNWARLTKCGHDTAYHDISGLVAEGILMRAPADGRGVCYELVKGVGGGIGGEQG